MMNYYIKMNLESSNLFNNNVEFHFISPGLDEVMPFEEVDQ
jgi:hypothetical protein